VGFGGFNSLRVPVAVPTGEAFLGANALQVESGYEQLSARAAGRA